MARKAYTGSGRALRAAGLQTFRADTGAIGVRVHGLDDFRRDLRRLESEVGKDGLKDLNFKVGELVRTRAERKASALTASNLAGGRIGKMFDLAAKSMTASRKQRAASVRLGGARAPFALGAEFGSKRWRQFPAWRGNQWPSSWAPEGVGFFLHPAIRESEAEIIDTYGDGIDRLSRIAFPD